MQGILRLLDNRWLARAGALVFVLGSLRFGWEKIQGNPADAITLLLFCLGIVLLLSPTGARRLERTKESPTAERRPPAHIHTPSPKRPQYLRALQIREKSRERRQEQLHKDLQDELVAIIDQGNALRGDAFSDVPYGPYSYWYEKTQNFIEKVFGAIERQRLDEVQGLDARLRHLGGLRDAPGRWHVRVDAEGVREAAEARRHVNASQRILLSASPAGEAQMPHRADKRELAAEIQDLAGTIDQLLERRRPEEEREVAAMVKRGKEIVPQDPKAIEDLAINQAVQATADLYRETFRRNAERLFDEAYEFGAVFRSDRSNFEDPKGRAVKGLPNRLLNIAERLERSQPADTD